MKLVKLSASFINTILSLSTNLSQWALMILQQTEQNRKEKKVLLQNDQSLVLVSHIIPSKIYSLCKMETSLFFLIFNTFEG